MVFLDGVIIRCISVAVSTAGLSVMPHSLLRCLCYGDGYSSCGGIGGARYLTFPCAGWSQDIDAGDLWCIWRIWWAWFCLGTGPYIKAGNGVRRSYDTPSIQLAERMGETKARNAFETGEGTAFVIRLGKDMEFFWRVSAAHIFESSKFQVSHSCICLSPVPVYMLYILAES